MLLIASQINHGRYARHCSRGIANANGVYFPAFIVAINNSGLLGSISV